MTEELITDYMRELSEQTAACSAACAEADKEIAEMKHQLEIKANARNKLAEPFEMRSERIRDDIESMVLIMAKPFECEYGQVKYKKGGERRSWNLDALDDICNADPDIKEKLWPHRKVSTTDPSVTIELKGD